MIIRIAATVAVLAACASGVHAQETRAWGRADCQRMATNPTLQQDFDLAKAVCGPRAEAAAAAATAAIPVGRGPVDAAFSGMERGATREKVGEATLLSCMAERGYLLRPESEHLAVCAARKPAPAQPKR